MWIVTIFSHLFCNTGYNTILRHAVAKRHIDPIFLVAIMHTALAVPSVIGIFVAKINWSLFNTQNLLLLLSAIICITIFSVVNAKALEITEASVFVFLFNFRIGIATLFGIGFLGEPVIGPRLVGGALIFAAGVILMGKRIVRPMGAMLSIFAAVLMASLNTLEKHLIGSVGYAAYMFPTLIIAGIAMWIIFFIKKSPFDVSFLKTRECGALLACRIVSAYSFTLSLFFGATVSVATYISSLTSVTIPIAAILFLKETDNLKKKVTAGLVALTGVTLIFLAVH